MKNEDKIRVLVPVSAPDLDAIFKNKRWADDARALFHYMHREKRIMAINRNYRGGLDRDSGWVSVNALAMKKGLGLSDRLKPIRDKLVEQGCLEVKLRKNGQKAYTNGMYSMCYRVRIPSKINGRKYRQEFITHDKTLANIRTFYSKNYKQQRKEFLDKMEWYRPNLELAEKMYLSDAALDFAEQQSPKDTEKLLGSIATFNSATGRFISTCKFAGRIHSFAGGLDKKLRPFVRVQGQSDQLVCVDVNSAQVYLLATMLNHPYHLIDLVPEFKPILHKITKRQQDPSTRTLLNDCLEGEFYETLMDASGIASREKVKTRVFQHILFSSAANHDSKKKKKKKVQEERRQFRDHFKIPYKSPYKALTEIKGTQLRTLPFMEELTKNKDKPRMYRCLNALCQRLEVAVFLNMITKRLNAVGVISLTVHDSWIFKASQLQTFEDVFNQVFEELAIKPPKLHIDYLNCATDIIEPQKTEEK